MHVVYGWAFHKCIKNCMYVCTWNVSLPCIIYKMHLHVYFICPWILFVWISCIYLCLSIAWFYLRRTHICSSFLSIICMTEWIMSPIWQKEPQIEMRLHTAYYQPDAYQHNMLPLGLGGFLADAQTGNQSSLSQPKAHNTLTSRALKHTFYALRGDSPMPRLENSRRYMEWLIDPPDKWTDTLILLEEYKSSIRWLRFSE